MTHETEERRCFEDPEFTEEPTMSNHDLPCGPLGHPLTGLYRLEFTNPQGQRTSHLYCLDHLRCVMGWRIIRGGLPLIITDERLNPVPPVILPGD